MYENIPQHCFKENKNLSKNQHNLQQFCETRKTKMSVNAVQKALK